MTSTTGLARSILISLTAIFLICIVSCSQGSDRRKNDKNRSNASLPAPFDPLDLATYGTAKPIEPKGYFAIAIRYVHPPRVEWMENEGVAEYRLLLLQGGKVLGATKLIPPVVFSSTVGPEGQAKALFPVLHDWIYVDMCEALLGLPAEEAKYQRARKFARGAASADGKTMSTVLPASACPEGSILLRTSNFLCKISHNPSKSVKSIHSEPKPVLKRDKNTQAVVYKMLTEGSLELDIDIPPDEAIAPVILYAHSWSGNKNQLKAYSTRLAQEGVAGVRINYRKLSDGHSFEQAISDVRDAFQWIRDNAEKYHFDTERMGIAGASAGGLLSALVALENTDCRIYIGFNGGYDLVQKDGSKWPPDDRIETLLAGKNKKKARQKWSAIHQIPAGNLPAVLLLHGTKDETITISVARRFQKALIEQGGIAELCSFEGEEHGFFNANLTRFPEIYEMVYNFVMMYLVNKP